MTDEDRLAISSSLLATAWLVEVLWADKLADLDEATERDVLERLHRMVRDNSRPVGEWPVDPAPLFEAMADRVAESCRAISLKSAELRRLRETG